MQDLQWFLDKEMDSIIMITPTGKEVESTVANKKEAKYYHDLQAKGFTFRAKLKIHTAPPTGCLSREG